MSRLSLRPRVLLLSAILAGLAVVSGSGQVTVTTDEGGVLLAPENFFAANAADAAAIRTGTETNRLLTPLGLGELLQARHQAGGGAGGMILLNAGTGVALAGVFPDAGDLDLSGGAGAGARGGNLYLFGGDGSGAAGGTVYTAGGAGAAARGGNLYTRGGAVALARGGDISTQGDTLPGGDLLTFDGGGKLDTRTGLLELGLPDARTTLRKTEGAAGNTVYLPPESGRLATQGWVGSRNLTVAGATATEAFTGVETAGLPAGTVFTASVAGVRRSFALRAETAEDVVDGTSLLRPADYDATTNKVVLADGTLVEARPGAAGARTGRVVLNAGSGAAVGSTTADAGVIDVSGGSGAGTFGGNLSLFGGAGVSASGGAVTLQGGAESNTRGGQLDARGGSAPAARGGDLLMYGGTLAGGDVFTFDGGGRIDTRTGLMEFGLAESRTSLLKSEGAAGNAVYLPLENGLLATQGWVGTRHLTTAAATAAEAFTTVPTASVTTGTVFTAVIEGSERRYLLRAEVPGEPIDGTSVLRPADYDATTNPVVLADTTVIETRAGAAGAVTGRIFLNAGTGAAVNGHAADSGIMSLSGGSGAGAYGGNVLLFGGSGSGAQSGSLLMQGGAEESARGGSLFTRGGTAASARGGDLFTYGGTAPGGDIFTHDGGGRIDTRLGLLELGFVEARTTLQKSALAAGNLLLLPVESGVLATRGWAGARNLTTAGLTGAAAFAGVETAGLSAGTLFTATVNGQLRTYLLRPETSADVPDGMSLVRPADYDAGTNKVVLADLTIVESRPAASGALGGKVFLNAGSGPVAGGIAPFGGTINTSGGTGGGAFGGSLLTYGGALPGGNITTADGGGRIDTRTGLIELGPPNARTTVQRGTTPPGNTLTLPTETGTLATREWSGTRNLVAQNTTQQALLAPIVTVGLPVGFTHTLTVVGMQRAFMLRAEQSTDVVDGVMIVRPADYHAVTNKVVFADVTADGSGVDVRLFGAKGDGVTDDRIPIQAAIDYAGRTRREVFLPPGEYFVSPNAFGVGLTLPSSFTLRGAGWSSVIRFPSPGLTVCLGNAASYGDQAAQDAGDFDVNVRDLKLDLQGTGNNGVVFGGVTGGSIINVWVEDAAGYGIHLVANNGANGNLGRPTDGIMVRGCRVTGVLDVGIELSGANHCSVVNNYVEGTGLPSTLSAAYEIWNGSQSNTVTGNVAVGVGPGNLMSGYRIDPQPTPDLPYTMNNIVSDNTAFNVRYGFKCHGLDGQPRTRLNTFKNNHLSGSKAVGSYGVWLVNADDMRIEGNVFSDFENPFVMSDPILSNNSFTCDGAVIEGNTWKSLGNPIVIHGLRRGSFSNNRIHGSVDGRAVDLFGAMHSVVRGNLAWDLGTGVTTPFLLLRAAGVSESQHNVVEDNVVFDSRTGSARKSGYVVGLFDGTSNTIVRGNAALNTSAARSVVINAGLNYFADNLPQSQEYNSGQIIYSSTTEVSSEPEVETNLIQVPLQHPVLKRNGDYLEATAVFTFAANDNLKRVKVYVGTATAYDSGRAVENGRVLLLKLRMIRSGPGTQLFVSSVDGNTGQMEKGGWATASLNLEQSTSLRITGTGVQFQDVIFRSLTITFQANQ